jgi:hypothetical protein
MASGVASDPIATLTAIRLTAGGEGAQDARPDQDPVAAEAVSERGSDGREDR